MGEELDGVEIWDAIDLGFVVNAFESMFAYIALILWLILKLFAKTGWNANTMNSILTG